MGGIEFGGKELPIQAQEAKATGEKILSVSWASWPPDGDLGAQWLLAVGRELLLARKPWKAGYGSLERHFYEPRSGQEQGPRWCQ